MTVLERIEWVLANVQRYQGRGGQSLWSEDAFGSNRRTHLGVILTRLRQGKGGADERTLRLLAEAAGVSTEWFVHGRGDPDDPESEVEESAQARAPMVRAAFDAYTWPPGTTAETVAAVWTALAAEEFAHRGAYIPPTYWTTRINEELAARKGKRIATVDTSDPVEAEKARRRRTRS